MICFNDQFYPWAGGARTTAASLLDIFHLLEILHRVSVYSIWPTDAGNRPCDAGMASASDQMQSVQSGARSSL